MGGESQQGTLRVSLISGSSGRYLSAACLSCNIQLFQLVTVLRAVLIFDATEAAEIDLKFGPPIL